MPSRDTVRAQTLALLNISLHYPKSAESLPFSCCGAVTTSVVYHLGTVRFAGLVPSAWAEYEF